MTWQPIVKPAGNERAPVEVTITNHVAPKLGISIAHGVLPKGWTAGTALSAATGTGEHFGRLRLARDGIAVFRLSSIGGGTMRRVTVFLPMPAGVDEKEPRREAVAFEADGDALILTLPKWAIPVGQRAAAAIGSAPRPLPVAKLTDVAGSLMGDPPPRGTQAGRGTRQKTGGGGVSRGSR